MVSLSNYCIWYLFFYIYFHEVEHSLCRKFMHICKIWDNDLTYNPTQKSLGQYCNIHIFLSFLGSLLKQYILFENLLQYSLPHTLYKVETRKKNLDTRVQHCLWGEGRGWTCVNWMPQNNKSVPRLLSTIVVSGLI